MRLFECHVPEEFSWIPHVFTDAGSNAYVSAKGRVQIISRWDLNNDGFLDIIMPAGHGQIAAP